MPLKSIQKADLSVGMYVELNLSWFDHPFASSRFLIKDQATLTAVQSLKKLGDDLQWDPDKSQLQMAEQPEPEPKPVPNFVATGEAQNSEREALKDTRASVNRAERKLVEFGNRIRHLMPNLTSGAPVALEAAADIAGEVSSDLVSDPNSVMQLINVNTGDDGGFANHAINVTALSVMLARAADIDEAQVCDIGLGAFLHDIGVTRLPSSVVRKKTVLSLAEQRLYDDHVNIGVRIAEDNLPAAAIDAIKFHHAHWDGTGNPKGIKGDQIPVAAQIVAIANRYDNLCNPRAGQAPLPPTDAIKQIFRKERRKFNPRFVDLFIRCLGIYPPGTLVGLSDDQTAVVVASNPDAPLKPSVVVYDPMVNRSEAVPLDLSKEAMPTIARSYLLSDLPGAVGAYLALSSRLHYYLVSSVDQDIIDAGSELKRQLGIETDPLKGREIIE